MPKGYLWCHTLYCKDTFGVKFSAVWIPLVSYSVLKETSGITLGAVRRPLASFSVTGTNKPSS